MTRNGVIYLWKHEDFPKHTYGFRIYADDDKDAVRKVVNDLQTSVVVWHR